MKKNTLFTPQAYRKEEEWNRLKKVCIGKFGLTVVVYIKGFTELKNITIKFNRDAGADAWANGQLVVTTKFVDEE